MSFEPGFDPNSDQQQEETVTAEHHLDFFAILKFALAVVVAVSIVVYALIWMKQYTGTSVVQTVEEEMTAEKESEVEISAEQRQAILDSMNDAEEEDEAIGSSTDTTTAASDIEQRQAILDSMNDSEEEKNEDSTSIEQRQAILNAMQD